MKFLCPLACFSFNVPKLFLRNNSENPRIAFRGVRNSWLIVDINSLLANEKYIVILYETRKHYGHWCCLFRNNKNNIEFFDSYGIFPDDELKYATKSFRKKNNMMWPHLTYLLLSCPYKIEYNNHKFQKMSRKISTCGRWCLIRCLLSAVDIDNFYKLFKKYKDKDKVALFLTDFI